MRDGQPDLVVLSKEKDQLALAINSVSTGGPVEARVVDVGRARAADFEGRDLSGAVVLGDTDLGSLFRESVVQRGAIGVISSSIAPCIVDDPDVLQWTDSARHGPRGLRLQGVASRRGDPSGGARGRSAACAR